MNNPSFFLKHKFRKFYPVIIDVETTGFNDYIHSLLEIALITLKMNQNGWLKKKHTIHFHIKPFEKSYLHYKSLLFNKIHPFNTLRQSIYEDKVLNYIFDMINQEMKNNHCNKSIVVAHNANFDHNFIMKASKKYHIKNNPFHPFVIFDTATLSGCILKNTVLSKSCKKIGLSFNNQYAHSALYDAIQTANLFCKLINNLKNIKK